VIVFFKEIEPMPSHLSGLRPFSVRTLKATISLLLVFLAARAVVAQANAEINPWKPSGTVYWIASPIRLNLGFTDQNGKPSAAEVSSLSAEQLAGLPPGLLQAKGSELFTPGHFDALWSAMKGGICNDVQQAISTLENHSPNSPYNIQPCAMNAKGYLTANFQESWEDDSMNMVNGRRIRFTYQAPLNGVTFWMTSPHTCHVGSNCPTEPTDPAFTIVFTAYLTVTCTSTPNATSFDLPVTCAPAVDLSVDGVYGGDVTSQLVASATKFTAQLAAEGAAAAASGGTVAPEAVVAAIGGALNLAVQGIGTLIAAGTDAHLRDQVSAYIIGFVNSPTLDSNSTKVSNDFNALFQNLYQATLNGLRPFVIGISPKLDFDFGLIYPLPAKPQIQNTTAANNKGSLFSQTIAVSQPEVVAGQMLPVTASFFRGAYVNAMNIAWNKTVLGDTKSSLVWGPPKVTITTPALTFNAIDLKPATQYTFQVHECDGITCAPLSDVLTTGTEATGSNDVYFWLDNNTGQIIGHNTVGAAGGQFLTNVLIPATTAAGAHLLHAGSPGGQPATASITVCQVGGCGPTVGVLNTSNNTLYPPGSVVEVGLPVVLRGSKFAPGGSVWIWVDSVKGTKAGAAPVGPLGNFQASFTMPMIMAGKHNLLAIELKPGVKLPLTPKGKIPVIPPQDLVSASVSVYVQAQAQ
jgi:hypothetical protein